MQHSPRLKTVGTWVLGSPVLGSTVYSHPCIRTPFVRLTLLCPYTDVINGMALIPYTIGEPPVLSEQGGAYAWDENASARLCTKNVGGLMREEDGGGGRICGTLRYTKPFISI